MFKKPLGFFLLLFMSSAAINRAETFFNMFSHSSAQEPPSFPVGGIIFVDTGTCPAGFDEVSSLSTKVLRGTVAANGDVGGTGGSDTYVPAGTNSAPTFTG